MAAASGVYIHPFKLEREGRSCAFCMRNGQPARSYPLEDAPALGWYCCETEGCLAHLLACQNEYRRRLAGRHLGNSREPIRYGGSDSSDDDAA